MQLPVWPGLAVLPRPRRRGLAVAVLPVALALVAPVLAWWSGGAQPGAVVPVAVVVSALAGVVVRALVWGASTLLVVGIGALAQDWAAAGWQVGAVAVAAGLAHVLGGHLERTERARALAEDRSAALTVRDELTGCVNQRGLQLVGEQVLQDVRRRGDAVHGVVVRVHRLEEVERRLGRGAADEVVLSVAEALRAGTRGTDVVASGPRGEFRVIGPGTGVTAGEVERRLRSHVLDRMPVPSSVWPCQVGIGCASLEPWDSGDIDDVLRRAEDDLSLRVALRSPSAPGTRVRRRP